MSSVPPSILNARFENRHGVPPGTTSTAIQTIRRSVAFNGKWIRWVLVSDSLFAKRDLILLGLVLSLLPMSSGKVAVKTCNVFSPIMQRLAPVSKMANEEGALLSGTQWDRFFVQSKANCTGHGGLHQELTGVFLVMVAMTGRDSETLRFSWTKPGCLFGRLIFGRLIPFLFIPHLLVATALTPGSLLRTGQ